MNKDAYQDIKERLARLKALQMGTNHEGEAAAAAAGIQRLLLAYNLTDEDIPDIDSILNQSYENFVYDLKAKSHVVYDFRAALITTIARHNFCELVRSGQPKQKHQRMYRMKRSGKVYIVGQKDNVAVVIALYEYLVEEIRHLTRNAWKVAEPTLPSYLTSTEWKKAYRWGIVHKLEERFSAQRKQDIPDDDTKGNALVVQKDKALQDAVNEFMPKRQEIAVREREINMHGYHGGKEAGNSIKIQEELRIKQVALNS